MRGRGRPSAAAAGRGRAAAGGLLLGLAFQRLPLGFLSWFAFVPLLDALDARLRAGGGARACFRAGWTFGFVFYLVGMHWIARLSEVAITVPWLKYPAAVAAAAYLALFTGVAAALAGALARRSGLSLAATFPPSYLAVEVVRGSGELGFPWFQPGYAQHAYTALVQMAALGGVGLVTLWVLVLNVLVWRALTARARGRAALGAALALLLPWAWGTRALDAAPSERGPAVALIQGNIPGALKWSGRHQREILATFVRLTEQAAADTLRPSLAIWPETATGSWLRKQPEQAVEVALLVARTGVPVFAGFADYEAGPGGALRTYNAAGLFGPRGAVGERYAKRHLVPFGERMPFQWLVPALGRLELGQAEWTPGRGTVLFPSAAGPFASLVCFESIFPDLARGDVRRGARWLVNVTNDEWFGNSVALDQHAAMAVFRAVENRVPVARCANTGLTLVVDAWGRVIARLPAFREAVLVARLPRPGPATPFTRWGDWPGFAALLGVVALASSRLLVGPGRLR
uniref:Apolipoprotein N-acyltransferase n=1 Tax=Eiseniibacteriota bacterium TaxID=2212470 RepID=A0A832MLK2_UNCEI